MRKRKRLFLYIPCVIAALAIISLLLFIFLFNLDNYRDFFVKKMESALHRPVSIGKVEAVIYKGLKIRFSDFTIKGEDGLPYLLKADHLDVSVHPFSILRRRIFISKLELEGPTVYLVRNKQEDESGGGDATGGFLKLPTFGDGNMKLLIKNFAVYRGRFIVVDKLHRDESTAFELDNVNLLIKNLLWLDAPSVRLTGRLSRSGAGGEGAAVNIRVKFLKHPLEVPLREVPISASVKLDNFPLNEFFPHLGRKQGLENFNALLDADAALIGSQAEGFKVEGSVNFRSLSMQVPAWDDRPFSPHEASVLFKTYLGEDVIRFDNLTVNLDGIKLTGSLLLDRNPSPDRKVYARFDSSPFDLNAARRYLPSRKLPSRLSQILENVTEANVQLKDIEVIGTLEQLKKWSKGGSGADVQGAIALTDVSMNVSDDRLPLRGMDAEFVLDGNNLTFEISKGRFMNSSIKNVSGRVADIFDEPALTANIFAHVDFADAYKIISLRKDSLVPGFLGRIEGLDGSGDLILNLARKLSGKSTSLVGEIYLSKVFINHEDFPLPFEDVEGKVNFSGDSFDFTGLRGRISNSPFEITLAAFNFRDELPALSLRGSFLLGYDDLSRLLPSKLVDKLAFNGSSRMVFDLEGTTRGMDIESNFDLKGFSYRYNNFSKPASAEGKLLFKGRLVPSQMLSIKNLTLVQDGIEASLKGNISNFSDPLIDLQLRSENFDVGYLSQFITRLLPYKPRGGHGSLKFNFTGKPSKIETRGEVWLEGVTADYPSLIEPFSFADGKVVYRGGVFRWEANGVTMGRSRFSTRGVYDSKAQNKLSMGFDFSTLYSGDLASRKSMTDEVDSRVNRHPSKSSGPSNDSSSAAEVENKGKRNGKSRFPFSATIKADRFFVNKVKLLDVNTRLQSENGIWRFEDLTFNIADGRFKGALALDRLSPSGSQFEMNTDVIGLNLEKLIKQINPATDIVTGTLSFKGDIRGNEFDLEGIRKSISGKLKMNLSDGSIRRFKTLSVISSFINFPQLFSRNGIDKLGSGLPFRFVKADLSFSKGVMYTDNLVLDGPLVNLSTVGSVDFAGKKYDLTVGLKPLGDLGKIVGKVPLVGKLIAGGENSLTTTFFKVDGEFGKPKKEPTAEEGHPDVSYPGVEEDTSFKSTTKDETL